MKKLTIANHGRMIVSDFTSVKKPRVFQKAESNV